jgi:HD-like signal output (HDOD) protein
MDINMVVESARDLPPTPQILPKLRVALRNSETGVQEIEDIIRIDAPLTARILRLSNSAGLGGAMRCENIREAVGRLGFAEVYRTVAAAATAQVLGGELPVYNLNSGQLWESSIKRAVLMKYLADKGCGDPDQFFTIGLLSEIGKVVINSFYLERGLEIYGADEEAPSVYPTMERQILGFDHAQVGAKVLTRWGFSGEVWQPVAWMFEPMEAGAFQSEACLLRLAAEAGITQEIAVLEAAMPEGSMEFLEFQEGELLEVFAHATDEFEEMKDGLLAA